MAKWLWSAADYLLCAYETWRFKKEHPDAYKHLCDIIDNARPEDFTEVPTEGHTRLLIHKDALENLRKLGINEEDLS
jgi:hypothetical protein